MENYNHFLQQIIDYLGCGKRFARQVTETTIGLMLEDGDFERQFFEDCMNTEAGIVCGMADARINNDNQD